jgi:hypothetical protein
MSPKSWLFTLSVILIFEACTRTIPIVFPTIPPEGDTTKTVTPPPPIPYVAGTWQCMIDGVPYSGTIDTSFTVYDNSFLQDHPDTIIFCTGTSLDKRANIHFMIDFERYITGALPYSSTAFNQAVFAFDTCSTTILGAQYGGSTVQFTVDSVSNTSLQGHFSGTLTLYAPGGVVLTGHTVTNGQFSAGWRGGDHDPNSFTYMYNLPNWKLDGYDLDLVNGYVNEATIISNTLTLSGTPDSYSVTNGWIFQIRTDGTIHPGTYTSANGDVGMALEGSSGVTDSAGSLTVTISKVSGNVVYGSFSGTYSDGIAVTGGSFAARVKNYVPQTDSANQWGFGTITNNPVAYHIYGGNVINTELSSNNGRYYLTVNGESDMGASIFKVEISSVSPIAKGVYFNTANFPGPNNVDSFYFNSSAQIFGGPTHYDAISYPNPTMVIIDSIGPHYVSGELKNSSNFAGPDNVNTLYLQMGRFSGTY